MSTVLWFPVAALNSALRACERRPWGQWWMRGERKTSKGTSTVWDLWDSADIPEHLGALWRPPDYSRVRSATATVEKQKHGEKRPIFRGPCVQKQPVAVPCPLCSHRANYPSVCSSVERFMPQPHALNAGPSKAGSEWFSHVFAWLWRQGRCSMLLLKMTLCALFGCYVNNVEENGSQYIHGKTSLTWKTPACISQPPLAVCDQRSF